MTNKSMSRSWVVLVALLGGGLPLPSTGSREFEIPDTLEELREQLEFFTNELYGQENGCKDNQKPFLLHYDVDENTGKKRPVCISEEELLRRRIDENTCNTRVSLGPAIEGGCSQYNYVTKDRNFLESFTSANLKNSDYVVLPMHRNVPYIYKNVLDSPDAETQQYYTETKFLPCDMHSTSMTETQQKSVDLNSDRRTQGFCDVDETVKNRLCWSGTAADSTLVSQSEMLDGTFYKSNLPCDVKQHLTVQHEYSINYVTRIRDVKSSFHVTKSDTTNLDRALKAKNEAENTDIKNSEATLQSCSKWEVTKLKDLEQESYYTGHKNMATQMDYLWDSYGKNEDKCVKAYVEVHGEIKQHCLRDSDGGICYSDSEHCDVNNVWKFSSKRWEHCFRKDIKRPDDASGSPTFTRRDTNYLFYFNATSQNAGGNNACDETKSANTCIAACYDRCKAMKFPAFSVLENQINGKCTCSDYSMSVCPDNQKRTGDSVKRVSYDITPRCETEQCDSKTKYSDKLRPCQFTEEYRTQKCMEVCAQEDAQFMTTTESGLCLCSVLKRGDSNAPIKLADGKFCPWSTASRVYKDTISDVKTKNGYLGDSFVTREPLKSYQIHYSPYYERDHTPEDGVLICEKGSPLSEIYSWYARVTGQSFEDSVTIDELKSRFNKLD